MLPEGPNVIAPENVRVTHCPGASSNTLLPLQPLSESDNTICSAVHDDVEVVVVVVVVDDEDVVVDGTLGTNTTSFWVRQFFGGGGTVCPWLVVLVVVVTQFSAVKLPLTPIDSNCAVRLPVFVTCTMIVLVLPETDSETTSAVT